MTNSESNFYTRLEKALRRLQRESLIQKAEAGETVMIADDTGRKYKITAVEALRRLEAAQL